MQKAKERSLPPPAPTHQQMEALRAHLQSSEKTVADLRSQLATLQKVVGVYGDQLQASEDRVSKATGKLTALEAEVTVIRKKLEEAQQTIVKLQSAYVFSPSSPSPDGPGATPASQVASKGKSKGTSTGKTNRDTPTLRDICYRDRILIVTLYDRFRAAFPNDPIAHTLQKHIHPLCPTWVAVSTSNIYQLRRDKDAGVVRGGPHSKPAALSVAQEIRIVLIRDCLRGPNRWGALNSKAVQSSKFKVRQCQLAVPRSKDSVAKGGQRFPGH